MLSISGFKCTHPPLGLQHQIIVSLITQKQIMNYSGYIGIYV